MQNISFSDLDILWKSLIVIGSISSLVFLVLLVVIISLVLEAKKEQKVDLSEYDDFLNEFAKGASKEVGDNAEEIKKEYPELPKIKDFEGNVLKDLLILTIN